MQEKIKNLIGLHISVFLFGISGIFGKLLVLSPMIIVLGRTLFASIALGFVLLYLKQGIRLHQKKDYVVLAFMGFILAFHWFAFFQAIQLSTVAIGLITFATFPVFTVFLEPLFFKERIRLNYILLALLTFGGVIIIIPGFEFNHQYTHGALWGIASGLSFSVLSVLNRKYVQHYSGYVVAFYQDFWAMVFLMPFLFVIQPVLHTRDIILLILLGVVFTALSHTLFIKSLASVSAKKASIISSLEPVYGIVFAIFLLGEIPSLNVIVGAIIILGTAFYASVKSGIS